MKKIIICFGLLFICLSCVTYETYLSSGHKIDSDKAYVFGTFVGKDNTPRLVKYENQTIGGIVLRKMDSTHYNREYKYLPFISSTQTQMLEIEPGIYNFSGIFFQNAKDYQGDIFPVDIPKEFSALSREFIIKTGEAVYIGDFYFTIPVFFLINIPVEIVNSFISSQKQLSTLYQMDRINIKTIYE